MLHKTRGIVLSHLKYGDTSIVTTIYTEHYGRMPFLVNGVYGRKGKFHPTHFQPFTLLDIEAYINPKRDLQRIKELSFSIPFHSLPFDTTKSTIALFLTEILYKTLKEEEPNPPLFDFLFHSIQLLDVAEKGIANFHLIFLLHLSKHLGFFPLDNYSDFECLFDTQNGRFTPSLLSTETKSDRYVSVWLHKLLGESFEQMAKIEMNHQTRNALLNLLMEYFAIHMGGLNNIKSLSVLQAVFESE